DEDLRKDSECKDQKKDDNVNNTNNVNTVSSNVNAASTNEVNAVGEKTSIELLFDINMHALEDYSIFDSSRDDEDDDHPLDQVIGDLQSATQTRRMSKNLKEHGFVSTIQQRTNHKDLQNCLFACFVSQEEPKKNAEALGNFTYRFIKSLWCTQMDVKKCFSYGRLKKRFVGIHHLIEDQTFPDWETYILLDYKVKAYDGCIFISQHKYVAKILKKFRFIEVKTASTPMETQKPLLKGKDGEEVDVHIHTLDSDYTRASLDRKSTTGGKSIKSLLRLEKPWNEIGVNAGDSKSTNVSPSADITVPSQQELDLLFGPLYDEFFNDGTSRVNKYSSPTENSIPKDTLPSRNTQPTSEPTTLTNVHAEENNDNQAEFTNPFCTPEELHQLDNYKSGTRCNPFGKNVNQLKWLWKNKKMNTTGNSQQSHDLKQRLAQEEGIDFEESFAPVARFEAGQDFCRICCTQVFSNLSDGRENNIS
ncbi:hypothetical protein Tco_1320502, partial [Tanacetum coccineum]